MILIIDNSKDFEQAKMTPKIVNVLINLNINYIIIDSRDKLLQKVKDGILSNILGIILSGGPLCLTNNCNYYDISKNYIALSLFNDKPVLGICFGFQILCDLYGSKIEKLSLTNKGMKYINIDNVNFDLLNNLPKKSKFFFSHKDFVFNEPIGFETFILDKKILGIQNKNKNIYGFQFHPEGTDDGHIIIKNFIEVCLLKFNKVKHL